MINKTQKTETEYIIDKIKSKVDKLDKEKTQLLLNANHDTKFNDLKKNLGWDDTDNVIDRETRTVIESLEIKNKLVDSSIFDDDSIYDYCISNNYVLANIRQYRGKLDSELLEAIEKYSKDCDMRLESDANLDCLFLLCPFSDVQENKQDIKKSKRYKNKELPKLILLEKIGDKRIYQDNHYKVIFEIGNRKPIINLVNSIFKTSIKTYNFLNNNIAWMIGFLISIIISILCTVFNDSFNSDYLYEVLPLFINIITLILFLKIILPIIAGDREEPSFNFYNDGDYKRHNSGYISYNNTDWLNYYRYFNIKKVINVRIKVYIGSIFILLCSYLLMNGLLRINKEVLLAKRNVVVIENNIKPGFDLRKTYIRTGLFQYDLNEELFDMSEKAIKKKKR